MLIAISQIHRDGGSAEIGLTDLKLSSNHTAGVCPSTETQV